jgi:hypothetical protein
VQTALILTGMACGALLAATGLTLWGAPRQVPRLSLAVRTIRWLAGALLLVGVLFVWRFTPVSYPILMAALAAPPGSRRRHTHWSDAISVLPTLILAGVSLFWGTRPVGIETHTHTSALSVSVTEWVTVVCGGLGMRALGQSLSNVATPPSHTEGATRCATITHVLLTLVVSGTALMNLWQRGTLWGETVYESRLAGAWLAWNAVWLSPHRPLWLHAVLMTVAALLLIVLNAG